MENLSGVSYSCHSVGCWELCTFVCSGACAFALSFFLVCFEFEKGCNEMSCGSVVCDGRMWWLQWTANDSGHESVVTPECVMQRMAREDSCSALSKRDEWEEEEEQEEQEEQEEEEEEEEETVLTTTDRSCKPWTCSFSHSFIHFVCFRFASLRLTVRASSYPLFHLFLLFVLCSFLCVSTKTTHTFFVFDHPKRWVAVSDCAALLPLCVG
jgi:hypothetical protein